MDYSVGAVIDTGLVATLVMTLVLYMGIAIKLGKVSLDPELLPQAKAMLASVQDLVRDGTLSYGMAIAQKPTD